MKLVKLLGTSADNACLLIQEKIEDCFDNVSFLAPSDVAEFDIKRLANEDEPGEARNKEVGSLAHLTALAMQRDTKAIFIYFQCSDLIF
jgi:hypothetical protein